MTTSPPSDEIHFKQVITLGQCGLDIPDELVRQAAKRLDIILNSPPSTTPTSRRGSTLTGTTDGYPFPPMSISSSLAVPPCPSKSKRDRSKRDIHSRNGSTATTRSRKMEGRHGRKASTASMASIGAKGILPTPMKLSLSSISLGEDVAGVGVGVDEKAVEALKRVQEHMMSEEQEREECLEQSEVEEDAGRVSRWPDLTGWRMKGNSEANSLDDLTLGRSEDTITPATSSSSKSRTRPQSPPDHSSSPNIEDTQNTSITSPSTPLKPSKPSTSSFLCPTSSTQIAPIDPALAAAELASALTKHVKCGICACEGVNFPECRKCGMRFCTRECRVGEGRGGDGKR
jgi:hypothetical protein